MLHDNGSLIIKLILCVLILLQVSSIFYCYGFLLKSLKKENESIADLQDPVEEIVTSKASAVYQPQIAGYEELNATHQNDTVFKFVKIYEPCSEGVLCVPQIQCPAHVRMEKHEKPQACDLEVGNFGFCCVTGQNHTGPRYTKARTSNIESIPDHIVEKARLKFEDLMHNKARTPVDPGSPDFFHDLVFRSTPRHDDEDIFFSNVGLEQVLTIQELAKEQNFPLEVIDDNLVNWQFNHINLDQNCEPSIQCSYPPTKYRFFDGSCNHLFPEGFLWGAAGQPMERILLPAYEDGIWMPRQLGVNGKMLTSAREISRIVMADADRPHPHYNLMVMQFGQFISHDVLQSSPVRLENGDIAQCCTRDNSAVLPPEERSVGCLPIEVSPDDEFYTKFGLGCMNLARAALAPNTKCRADYGRQLNKVSHYIDASTVYGSSLETSNDLRTFEGGKLRTFNDFGRDLLPTSSEKNACARDATDACYKSGDGRTNQIISLVTMHMLFAREHNRIANILAQINPVADDENLFQEARRIIIAELQHITYNEYLPIIIGPEHMKRFRLTPHKDEYSHDYSYDINPSITNEFAAAAFRMGHSSVDGSFHIQHQDGQNDEVIQIDEVMFNPSRMRNRTFYDEMLITLLAQPMQEVDSAITHGLSRFLFRGSQPFGKDLAAINIERGRDHGLPSYNAYLELLGNPEIESFDQLPVEVASKLSQVYHSPEDIDLWVGGLLEEAVDGGIVGNTFAEIIADQFSRLKHGDRYYYENYSFISGGAFPFEQLQEIRKVTLARIICDNADHLVLKKLQPMVFVRPDIPGNEPVGCDSPLIPKMNLGEWDFNKIS